MPSPNERDQAPEDIRVLIERITRTFHAHDIDSPRTTAEVLAAHALRLRRLQLYTHCDRKLDPDETAAVQVLVDRRLRGEPTAYILGSREFWSLDMEVSPDVLIPRPETECLVEAALQALPRAGCKGTDRRPRILELGVGSGAVVVALARERPGWRFVGSDISAGAARMARQNARRHDVADRIDFVVGDWLDPFSPESRPFFMIVANPPYIATDALSGLQAEIVLHEPLLALDGGPAGMKAIGRIVREAPAFLEPGGWLILEIGSDQGPAVAEQARSCGAYASVDILPDYSGLDRVARLKKR